MRQGDFRKPYSAEESKLILDLWESGKTTAQIAYVTGRSKGAISAFLSTERRDGRYSGRAATVNKGEKVDIKVNGVKVADVPNNSVEKKETPATTKPKELTPREMIKKLYDMGYRIENNQLVCIQKVVVKLQDILNN